MTETMRLGLTLLEAAQAQKHVTVNEALLRLDAGMAVTVDGVGIDAPPSVVDGAVYIVGVAPTGDWSGHAGDIAYGIGGGWAFVTPGAGRRVSTGLGGDEYVYDGQAWRRGFVAGAASGAYTAMRVLEVDETLTPGASHVTAAVIPAGSLVIGVTGRVTEALGGATSWMLGVAGADDRYGSGLGAGAGSYALGYTGSPLAYYAETPLVMTSGDAPFSSGRVTLCVHLIEIFPPVAL
ncbi:MAG: DUF2793 domain-containing protein [Pseudomonadota bacterium]